MTLTSSSAMQSVLIVPSPALLSQLKCIGIPVTVVLFDWQHAQEKKKKLLLCSQCLVKR